MMSIAIIIPAYNETENLKNLVTKINQNLNNCEIYIIDDSKTNEGEKTLEQFKNINYIFRGKKLGRGSAVLLGIAKCIEKKFDIYIEMDADFSHNPDELEEKIKKFIQSKADILIASRYLKNVKDTRKKIALANKSTINRYWLDYFQGDTLIICNPFMRLFFVWVSKLVTFPTNPNVLSVASATGLSI